MARYQIVVTDRRHDEYRIEEEALQKIGAELKICNCVTQEDIVRECAQADGILLDMAPMGKSALEGLEKCRVINRYGVGCDNVDLEAAAQKGIIVTNVPDYCAEDVSDHVLALMMTCLRRTAYKDRMVRQGEWNIPSYGYRLQGKVLGLLGFGRIARRLAAKCSGFGFSEIMVYDPYVAEEECQKEGVKKAALEEVLSHADFLSLHMPVTPETRGMINKKTLSCMKQNAILINTGRGALICDEDLVEALKKKEILCAGLDTHNQEPLSLESGYLSLENVVLTDHTAYSTVESVKELKEKSVRNIIDVLSGRTPEYAVLTSL